MDWLKLKGKIIVFTIPACPNCSLIRKILRDNKLPFIDVNLDKYPSRVAELKKLAGNYIVPQIFFNDRRFGGTELQQLVLQLYTIGVA